MKNWIQNILGLKELIKAQNKTNELLEKVIKLQKHHINNSCSVHSDKTKVW